MTARINDFWTWFQRSDLLDLDGEELIKRVSPKLRKVKDSLVLEVGPPDQRPRELIFSADGLRENVDSIELLVDAAPDQTEWTFTRFRPPLPNFADMRLNFGGQDCCAGDLKFLAYTYENEPTIDLAVFAQWYDETGPPDGAMFIMLDMALGEYNVMCGIGEIRVYPLESAPDEAHAWSDLGELFSSEDRD